MKYIGVDVGGMSIKAGIVDRDGTIIAKDSIPTRAFDASDIIAEDIAGLINGLMGDNGLSVADIGGIGLGIPGSVYDEKGIVRYTCNINFRNFPLVDVLSKSLGINNVKISNDANCAALGEMLFGAGRGCRNVVLITVGTGIGTGIIVDGKMLTGNRSAGAEGGHVFIGMGSGRKCGCGKKGHFEAYASATALLRQTEEAAEKHPESLLNDIIRKDGLDGKTVFSAAKQGDKTAITTLKRYLGYLGAGAVSFANVFYPEIIIIGGGISNEGDAIIKPLDEYVAKNVYGAEYNPPIAVVAAELKNDAGIIGAAALAMP